VTPGSVWRLPYILATRHPVLRQREHALGSYAERENVSLRC
jgi:hypothetical protein